MATVKVNRAPVLTLWGAVVAQALGHDRKAALTLGKALAGLNAVSKGRRIGVIHETEETEDEQRARERARARAGVKFVELAGRKIPVLHTEDGVRAVRGRTPENPAAVEKYLERKLGDSLPAVRAAMTALARSLPRDELEKRAYAMYERFRPAIPAGEKGWGARGVLDLRKIEGAAQATASTSAAKGTPRSSTRRAKR